MIRHLGAGELRPRPSIEPMVDRSPRRAARVDRRRRPVREFLEERTAPAAGAFAAVPTGPVPPVEVAGTSGSSSSLPLGLQYAASETLGAADPIYAMAGGGAGYVASNPTNAYSAHIDAGGFSVTAGADSWSLTVSGIGHGDSASPLGAGVATATANRVEYDYGAITQWFVNGPMGLQQGFTINQRPSSAAAGSPLSIDMAQGGNLIATADPSGTSATLSRADGSSALVYGGLIAHDARGTALSARIATDGDGLSILVDDADAVYPLTIDPFVQQSKVVGSPAKPSQFFGSSVTISADGTLAAVGATGPSTGNVPGSVYIFTTDGSTWTRGAELVAGDGVAGDDFGFSIAMSADAGTLVVGARNATIAGRAGQGAAYVFRRNPSNGAWSQAAKLSAGLAGDYFGNATAVNAKGSLIVIGAPLADVSGRVDQGIAYVYAENSPGAWTPAASLTAFDGTAGALYGYSVAVDSTGGVVAVGAPSASGSLGSTSAQGGVYAYIQGIATRLTPNDAAAGDSLGYSVDLNDDGSFLLAGAPLADIQGRADQGAAYVFTRSWTSWAQTYKMIANDGAAGDRLGSAVAIDPTASTAIVATSLATVATKPVAGAAYVFGRGAAGAWSQSQQLVASDPAAYARFGTSVAIANGVAVAGAPYTPSGGGIPSQGSAYFYRNPSVLAVTSSPASQTVPAGAPITLTASSAGPWDRAVRWQVSTDGVGWSDIPGATKTWYSFTPAATDSGKRFRAIFSTGPSTTVATTSATLTVVRATPVLSITSNANPRAIGDPLAITVTAAGVGVVPGFATPGGSVTVTLQRDGTADAPITLGPAPLAGGKVAFGGLPVMPIGTYTVTASYAGDSTFAAAATTTSQVVVRGTTTLSANVPASAAPGSRVPIVITLTAFGGLNDMSGGIVVKDAGNPIGYPEVTTVGGVTTATFLTPPLAAENHYYQFMFLGNPQIQASSTGVYVLNATGSGGAAATPSSPASAAGTGSESAADSRTNGPAAPGDATTVSVNAGLTATLAASASSVAARHVQWQYRAQSGSADQYWINIVDANSAWYSFTPTVAMQGRQFRAVFTDLAGNSEASPVTALNVTSGMAMSVSTDTNPRRLGDPLTVTTRATAAVPGVGPITGGLTTIAIRREGSADILYTASGAPTNGVRDFAIPTTLGVGSYVVTATYSSPTFGVVSSSTSQVVVRGTTTLSASVPPSAAPGARVPLVITLTAFGGLNDMSGGIVVKDAGNPIGYPEVTTVGGVTTATFLTPPLAAENHYYQFMFLGNPQIQASSTGVYVLDATGSAPSARAAAASDADGSRTSSIAAPASASQTLPAVDGVALTGAFAEAAKKPRGSSAMSFWRSGSR